MNSAKVTQVFALAALAGIAGYFITIVASLGVLALVALGWLIVAGALLVKFGSSQTSLLEVHAPVLLGLAGGAAIGIGAVTAANAPLILVIIVVVILIGFLLVKL